MISKKTIFNTTLLSIISIFSFNSFAENAGEEDLPLKEIYKVAEVFSIIDKRYVEEVDKKELMLQALNGMVESVDPYSKYLRKQEANDFNEDIKGESYGIGVIITKDEKGLKIETVLKNSPAEKSGLESGDIIIKVGEHYIIEKYKNPFDAVDDIKGDIGSKVNLTLQKNTTKKIIEITIERDKFSVPSTSVDLLNDHYGYINISTFNENTYEQLNNKFKEFKNKKYDIKGYILDLRSNPGGILESSILISDLFLDKGKILSIKGKEDYNKEEFFAKRGDIINGKPLVVLINNGSASASEIVAGALQDNKRAIIVGQTSYGKGSVQSLIPLSGDDGDMLKLTIARYYTPSGRSIQAEGIVPDIYIHRIKDLSLVKTKELKEKDNENHLTNDTDYKADNNENKNKESLNISITDDYELNEALNTLKAITILD